MSDFRNDKDAAQLLTLYAVVNSWECPESKDRFYPISNDFVIVRDGCTGHLLGLLPRKELPFANPVLSNTCAAEEPSDG